MNKSNMVECPRCRYVNLKGTIYCENCGALLDEANSVGTRDLDKEERAPDGRPKWGTARFGNQMSVVFYINDNPEPVVVSPEKYILIGRRDEASGINPELDLTDYGAVEMGVSRVHAAIHKNDDGLTLEDMGSRNHTYLNGQRLPKNHPRVLRDGDEIMLGRMKIHVYFK